jgi:hypothetical protein
MIEKPNKEKNSINYLFSACFGKSKNDAINIEKSIIQDITMGNVILNSNEETSISNIVLWVNTIEEVR